MRTFIASNVWWKRNGESVGFEVNVWILFLYFVACVSKNYNFQANIDAVEKTVKPVNTSATDFDWRNYYHLETIYAWLDHIVEKYNKFVKPIQVGTSYEGVPIKGVKLSHKANNTAIVVEGGIHAREWISPATATFILDKLLTSEDKDVQDIAQNFDWIFFPVINPDGYKATFEKDRMWRKTRQPFGLCRGTDLNRNWNSQWNKSGSSSDPCAYVSAMQYASQIHFINVHSVTFDLWNHFVTLGLRRTKGVQWTWIRATVKLSEGYCEIGTHSNIHQFALVLAIAHVSTRIHQWKGWKLRRFKGNRWKGSGCN